MSCSRSRRHLTRACARRGARPLIDITFLVDNFERAHADLTARGLRFSPKLCYQVGTTADFYDPDGHWFSIYEPSETAMTWPSADKIRALRQAAASRVCSSADPASNGSTAPALTLDAQELLYLFVFVDDPDRAIGFYQNVLGLEAIEGGPCRRGVTTASSGVVKYDAGGTLITTHHVDADHAAKMRVKTRGSGSVVMVFHTDDLSSAMSTLSRNGVDFPDGIKDTSSGRHAEFRDPWGHAYRLYEPSSGAQATTVGSAVARVLAATL